LSNTFHDVPAETLQRLQLRLRTWTAQGGSAVTFLDTLLEAAGPLALLGAQGLWVAQPLLSLILPADEIGGLARLLEAPDGVAWLRAQIAAQADGSGLRGSMMGSADDIKAGG
jgi:hypothetical protein